MLVLDWFKRFGNYLCFLLVLVFGVIFVGFFLFGLVWVGFGGEGISFFFVLVSEGVGEVACILEFGFENVGWWDLVL